jgi:hypothetical protein
MAIPVPGVRWIVVAAVAWSAAVCQAAKPAGGRAIEAAVKPGKPFTEHATTTLGNMRPSVAVVRRRKAAARAGRSAPSCRS